MTAAAVLILAALAAPHLIGAWRGIHIFWTALALVAAAMASHGIPGDHTDPCSTPDPPAHCRWAANAIGDGR